MYTSKVSNVGFNAGVSLPKVQPSNNPPKEENNVQEESKIKQFLHKKEAPYIIGSVAIATTVIAILAIRKGKGKGKGKGLKNHPSDTPPQKPNLDNKSQEQPIIHNFGPWDDSEILEEGANVAHVDVAESPFLPDIIKQTRTYKAMTDAEKLNPDANIAHVDVADSSYVPDIIKQAENVRQKYAANILKFDKSFAKSMNMDIKTFYQRLADGSINISNEKYKFFITHFIKEIENIFQNINKTYVINNINLSENLYQSKQDYLAAFNRMINDEKSPLFGSTIKDVNDGIHLITSDGNRRISYLFSEFGKKRLKSIKDYSVTGNLHTVNLEFLPGLYKNYGTQGVHHLHKIEYFNKNSNKNILSILIDPTLRGNWNVIVNNPQTGEPVFMFKRALKRDDYQYTSTMYESGKPIIDVIKKGSEWKFSKAKQK